MKQRFENFSTVVPSHEDIARRAYELYCERGCEPGYDVDDWLQAEYELMQLPIRKIAEMEPPRTKRGTAVRKSIVTLVHTALVTGGVELANWMR